MMIRRNIDFDKELSPEQIAMLEALKNRPDTPDDENPEMSLEELKQFRKAQRNKQTVSLRLSPKALQIAKSLGKGYTSILSRILEDALSDSDTIRHYL